jgi:cell wall-associated NlpC family hydrolase
MIAIKRQDVVNAVRGWLNTPYHHLAKVKGAGVDCGQLVIAAFEEAGLPVDDPGFYTCDWHLHRDEDRYIEFVSRYLVRADDAEATIRERNAHDYAIMLPGTVIVFRVGRTFSHGGIVTQWPFFIHSSLPAGIVEEIDIRNSYVCDKPCRAYTYEGFEE